MPLVVVRGLWDSETTRGDLNWTGVFVWSTYRVPGPVCQHLFSLPRPLSVDNPTTPEESPTAPPLRHRGYSLSGREGRGWAGTRVSGDG